MKFALFSILVAAVHGSTDMAPANRALAQDFYISKAEVGDSPLPFVITYFHAAVASDAQKTLKIIEGDCPGGSGYSDDTGMDGVTVVDEDFSVATQTVFEIDVQPTGGPWSDEDKAQKKFCAWYGLGTDDNIYGYFEVQITATFIFNGEWECLDFATETHNPANGETTKTISAEVNLCDDMPQPLYPGQVACFLICPVAYDGAEDNDLYCLVDPLDVFKLAPGTCPTNPCDGGEDIQDWDGFTSTPEGHCVKVEFNIPLSYHNFDTVSLHVYGTTSFELCDAWVAGGGGDEGDLGGGDLGGGDLGVDPAFDCHTWDNTAANGSGCTPNSGVRDAMCVWDAATSLCNPLTSTRRLTSLSRKLQESDQARINSVVEFTTAPLEESSASGAMAGVAAAAAVGAAFLI